MRCFPFEREARWLGEEISFKVEIESFNKKISGGERLERIESMDYIPVQVLCLSSQKCGVPTSASCIR